MTKTQILDNLFMNWESLIKTEHGKFIRDGIIDEQLFEKHGNKKLLVIAKEPNYQGTEAWDFRDWWKDELNYSFSYRIAEWAFGIENNFPIYSSIWTGNNNGLNAIRKIAFMNIKKTRGKGRSDYCVLQEHLEKDWNFIRNQIEIIQPKIMILCLSWRELRDSLFPELRNKWVESGYDIPISSILDCKIIDFYHPSARNAPAAAYSLLQNVFRSDAFQSL